MTLIAATQILRLGRIRCDRAIQPRSRLHRATVEAYAELIRDDTAFPPVVVFHDGDVHWLADGYHRVAAARRAGAEALHADVRRGCKEEAIRYACGANSRHGRPLSNADKRRVVTRLLLHEQWQHDSDRQIARECGVSQPFVSKLRKELAGDNGYRGEEAAPSSKPSIHDVADEAGLEPAAWLAERLHERLCTLADSYTGISPEMVNRASNALRALYRASDVGHTNQTAAAATIGSEPTTEPEGARQ